MKAGGRQSIATYGSRGRGVRVFVETGAELVRVQWREHGLVQTKSWSNTTEGKAAARAFGKALGSLREKVADPTVERITLRDLWDKYVTAEFGHLRVKSKANYVHHWKQFELFAGRAMFADQVSGVTLDGYRAYLVGRKLAISQQQAAIAMVKIVFRWALRRELLERDRVSLYRFKVAKEQRSKGVPEYTPEEYAKLLAAFDPRKSSQWRAWVLTVFLGEQGPRINAALHLKWSDVDFASRDSSPNGSVRFAAEYDKLGRERVQPLTEAARDALFVALGWCSANGSGWIFPTVREEIRETSDGTYTTKSFTWMLREAETRAKVDYIPNRGAHSLRRMAMGNALAVSKNVVDAMWWIGDTDLRQAKKYATERDTRMGDMATMLGNREPVNAPAKDAISETVTAPQSVPDSKSAPVEAEALSTTMT